MATGILGANLLSTGTLETVYTVPAGKQAVVTLNVLNAGFEVSSVRVALSGSATPDVKDYIEWDVPIQISGVLERTGLVLGPSQSIFLYTGSSNVNVVAYGYEETAA